MMKAGLRERIWNLWPARPLWRACWRRRFQADEQLLWILGWRSCRVELPPVWAPRVQSWTFGWGFRGGAPGASSRSAGT